MRARPHVRVPGRTAALAGCCVAAVSMSLTAGVAQAGSAAHRSTVVVKGLNAPRGLAFGPSGLLYVAEAGTGGSHVSSAARCKQVPDPIGPYKGGFTSRISVIKPNGKRVTVASRLPSDQTAAASGGLVSGIADLAFVHGRLYGLDSAAGCSHGHPGRPNSIFRVNHNGSTTRIANLSKYQRAHPTAHENPGDFEPDGTWYSMVVVGGEFFAVEPNHGEVDSVTRNGVISRFVDVSKQVAGFCHARRECGSPNGHVVPTAITYHHGAFYLVNLDVFDPGFTNHSHVYRITKQGVLSQIAGGLNAAVGIAFDGRGRMYVLESFTGSPTPVPNTGKLVRRSAHGWQTILSGLNFPTAMTLGPHGNLYISNCGYGCPAGAGEVLRTHVG